jgi:hypothetical protein
MNMKLPAVVEEVEVARELVLVLLLAALWVLEEVEDSTATDEVLREEVAAVEEDEVRLCAEEEELVLAATEDEELVLRA